VQYQRPSAVDAQQSALFNAAIANAAPAPPAVPLLTITSVARNGNTFIELAVLFTTMTLIDPSRFVGDPIAVIDGSFTPSPIVATVVTNDTPALN
jgi:hypothetical protein